MGYRAVKRGVDLVGAGVLILVLAPVFVVVGILIKLDSPGPVFFRQRRTGVGGREFYIWKFRSMVMTGGGEIAARGGFRDAAREVAAEDVGGRVAADF